MACTMAVADAFLIANSITDSPFMSATDCLRRVILFGANIVAELSEDAAEHQ